MIGWRLAHDDGPNGTVDIFRPNAVHDSVQEDSVGDDKPPLQRDHPVGLPNLMGAVDDPCNLRPRIPWIPCASC